MTAPAELVAPVEDVKPFEGAGVFSSAADTIESVGKGDGWSSLTDGASFGIDALGAVMDPVGSLASAGVGWIIEHVWFLREPLDALAGDPNRIKAQAETWHRVSVELGKVAAENRSAVAAVQDGWTGDAAAFYQRGADLWSDAVDIASASTADLANRVMDTGALIGSIRSFIRDEIAGWLGDVVKWAIAAMATAPVTLGGSLAALGVAIGLKAVELADKFVAILRKLEGHLGKAAEAVRKVVDRLEEFARTTLDRAASHGVTVENLDGWYQNPRGASEFIVAAEKRLAEGRATALLNTAKNAHEADDAKDKWARTGG
jgi:uncharacterized protein YukE